MEPNPIASLPGRLGVCAFLALAAGSHALAGDSILGLQGIFCNSEAQIDSTLAHLRQGVSPRAAVEFTNRSGVFCTFVDRLGYVVERPVDIGRTHSSFAPVKYRAALVGVWVGDNLRPVAPPAEVFFVTPGPVVGAAFERPT